MRYADLCLRILYLEEKTVSKVMKATFDSQDMAEFALIRLKRDGINVESYHVGYAQEPVHNSGLNSIVFPYNTDYGFGAGGLHSEIEHVQPFGGVLYSTENNKHERRSLDDDIYSSDVKMVLRVPDQQASDVDGILRSCHGYQIQTL